VTEPHAPGQPALVREQWNPWRVIVVVLGSLALLVSLGLVAAGIAGVAIDQSQREDGFVTSPTEELSTPTYAIVSESLDVDIDGPDWVTRDLIGTIRITSDSGRPVFLGIAPSDAADVYLRTFRHAVVSDLWDEPDEYDERGGGSPAAPPAGQGFWAASASGTGEQTLDWELEDGSWTVVAMNADASAGVTADLSVGAELDALLWLAIGVLLLGVLALALGAWLLYVGIPRRRP
jgi:hypothetical protein